MTKWALKDARTIMEWDQRIAVVDQFPMFKNIHEILREVRLSRYG